MLKYITLLIKNYWEIPLNVSWRLANYHILLFHMEENSPNSLHGIKMCVSQKLTYKLGYSSYSYIYNPRQKSLKHLCTSLSACNVEMLLQSCVATTTLQKGGGKQKGAEFSKAFQGFCLRLSELAGNFRSMRKKCQIRLKHF